MKLAKKRLFWNSGAIAHASNISCPPELGFHEDAFDQKYTVSNMITQFYVADGTWALHVEIIKWIDLLSVQSPRFCIIE